MSTYLVRVPNLNSPANVPSDLALMQADINKYLNQVQNRILGGNATIPFRNHSQAGIRVNFPRAMGGVPVVVAVAANSILFYCECSDPDTTGFTLAASEYQGAAVTVDLLCYYIAVLPG